MNRPMRRGMFWTALALAGLTSVWATMSLTVAGWPKPGVKDRPIDLQDPAMQKLLCGPKSLCTALRRLGVPVQLEMLTKTAKITTRGVAVSELVRLADGIEGVAVRRATLSWEQLTALEGTALLWVDDRHFVAADPRETDDDREGTERRVRIYDSKKPARWLTREELAPAWKGETIVLRRKATSSPKGPGIEWEHCLSDAGCFKRNDVAAYRFDFRNTGREVLRIESVDKSCNCSSYEVSATEIAPGQRGWVQGTVRLEGRRGKFSSFLLVRTNDPHHPQTVLVMDALVYNEHVLSEDGAHFGHVPQGETRALRLFVHDPGEENLKIVENHIETSKGWEQAAHVKVGLQTVAVEEGSPYVGMMGAYPVKVGDYVLHPMITVDANCPPGPLTGTIVVATSLAPPLNRIEVPLDGRVVSHVCSRPAAVMLTLGPEGQKRQEICLESLAPRPFAVRQFWADVNAPIRIEPSDGQQRPRPCYEISTVPAALTSASRMAHTAVHFQLEEGSVLDVPVLLYQR